MTRPICVACAEHPSTLRRDRRVEDYLGPLHLCANCRSVALRRVEEFEYRARTADAQRSIVFAGSLLEDIRGESTTGEIVVVAELETAAA